MKSAGHRKLVKHRDITGHVHELTCSTYKRRPLLSDPRVAEIVLDAVERAHTRGLFDLLAFVVMPEHVHLLLVPRRDETKRPIGISRILFAIKRPASFRIRQHLEVTQPALIETLTIRERPDKSAFRFWQEGGGYDRNLTNRDAIVDSIRYIHDNPVRRGLCQSPQDWAWSSATQWLTPNEPVPTGVPVVNRSMRDW